MNSFKEKIRDLKKSELIKKGDKILIAFSGGPDSVFLFLLLNFLKKEYELEIFLLYVNHNLRNDVKNDLEFVKNFSKKNNVKIFIENLDVLNYCKKNKKSVELGARELRYKVLIEKLKESNFDKIATGHNLDDNVETLVFRLLRGTSIKGLKGIPVKRENIIRPILQFEKREILDYLKRIDQDYIVDYTNKESDYSRNYIRNEIFPMFSKINRNFKNKINDLILEINERENEFEKISEKNKKNKKHEKKDEFVKFLSKNNVEISRKKIDQIFNSIFDDFGNLRNDGEKDFDLEKNKILKKSYFSYEIFEKNKKNLENQKKFEIIKKNQSIEWYNSKTISFFENILEFENFFVEKKDFEYTFLIFKDNFVNDKSKIVVRNRENGDRIWLENLGQKKIKKILIDKKISKSERDFIPIVELVFENKKKENIILTVSDIKFSKFVKKFFKEDIKNFKNNNKILVIGRKKWQTEIKTT